MTIFLSQKATYSAISSGFQMEMHPYTCVNERMYGYKGCVFGPQTSSEPATCS